jgi:hypothetical protein
MSQKIWRDARNFSQIESIVIVIVIVIPDRAMAFIAGWRTASAFKILTVASGAIRHGVGNPLTMHDPFLIDRVGIARIGAVVTPEFAMAFIARWRTASAFKILTVAGSTVRHGIGNPLTMHNTAVIHRMGIALIAAIIPTVAILIRPTVVPGVVATGLIRATVTAMSPSGVGLRVIIVAIALIIILLIFTGAIEQADQGQDATKNDR